MQYDSHILQRGLSVGVKLCQFLVGCTFIISGLTKANDPLGMTTLLQDYMNVAGLHMAHWSVPVTMLAILLAVIEVMMGIYLLVGSRKSSVASIALLFMTIMMVVTGVNLATDIVPECGCFGSALVLTNAQSFAKNIVLISMALLLCWKNTKMYEVPWTSVRMYITTIITLASLVLSFWAWYNLPLIDFTPYAVGTDVVTATMGEYDVVDGQSVEISAPTIKDFALINSEGDDVTDLVLFAPDTVTLITVPSEAQADSGNGGKMTLLWDEIEDKGQDMYVVIAGTANDAERFKDRTGIGCSTLFASIEMLQTIVRANPGMVKLYEGKIIQKENISK